MAQDQSVNKTKKNAVNRKAQRSKQLELPAGLQEVFDAAVKDAAGRPLSMAPGSPLGTLIGRFVEVCLSEEMNEHLGYEPHQRLVAEQSVSDSDQAEASATRRANTRNGYSPKQLKTSMGVSQIEMPRDRAGAFTPQILPKHQSMTAEIEERVVAMYASGMTTRDIAEHVRQLYHFSASEDFVSHLVARLDPELNAWRNRALEEIYAIAYIDAVHLKIRHSNGVTSTAVYIISGYGESGIQEILGIWIAPSEDSTGHGESASYWHTIFMELRNRGVTQILIACSDMLSGLQQAVCSVFADAQHLPCVVHLMRASLQRVSWQQRREVASDLRRIYQAVSYQQAEQALDDFRQKYAHQHPGIITLWEKMLPNLAALWSYSAGLRKMVYTTNPQENINRQIRKVTKNRSSMPSIDSALRLVTLVAMKIDQRTAERDRVRHDWPRIVQELHIHFAGRLPDNWGFR